MSFLSCFIDCLKVFGLGRCSFHEAVLYTSLRSLNRTIKYHTKKGDLKAAISVYDDNGRTPLICAIISKRPERSNPMDIIDALLSTTIDVNIPDNVNGMTPLHYAAFIRDEK